LCFDVNWVQGQKIKHHSITISRCCQYQSYASPLLVLTENYVLVDSSNKLASSIIFNLSHLENYFGLKVWYP